MSTMPYGRGPAPGPPRGDNLADILERILDKGLVVAGDIQLNLLDIEVITIKVRLLLASADTAQQMGIDWWQSDPFLTSQNGQDEEKEELRERVAQLEAIVAQSEELPSPAEPAQEPATGSSGDDVAAEDADED